MIRVRDDNAAVLARAGVAVIISGLGGGTSAGRLRQLAGMAVADGMEYDRALAAVTTVPAALYRISDRGALKPGAAADLVVWSGDPFELSTRAEHVFINGREQNLHNRHKELLERYRALPAQKQPR
jgi:imidazolonepropionase-like amidohydrolase